MLTLAEDRAKGAAFINSLTRDELFDRYEITRVGNITGFDCIGVPVYHVTRPAGLVLSQNSGKGLESETARVGAIAEGIEYHTFEHPVGEYLIGQVDRIDSSMLPIAAGSKWTPQTNIPLESSTKWDTGETVDFPSDLLWMVHRKQTIMHFQMTTNGQAVGSSFESAFMAGIYECVERDATTIALERWETGGPAPRRIDPRNASVAIDTLIARIEDAGLKLYLFDCTSDIPIKVYWAALVDPSGDFFTTAGWSCNLHPIAAAESAILEAIQSRCVYIAGARDDLIDEEYRSHKSRNSKGQQLFFESLPVSGKLLSYTMDLDLASELSCILNRLGSWKDNIYYKHIDLGELHAVKTVILGLEPPRNQLWQPSARYLSALASTA